MLQSAYSFAWTEGILTGRYVRERTLWPCDREKVGESARIRTILPDVLERKTISATYRTAGVIAFYGIEASGKNEDVEFMQCPI